MSSAPTPPPFGAPQLMCYRHPDRSAGVSCQRCNRPICPSCMVTASVGFQCPECAKEGAKASRSMSMADLSPTSYVTLVLMAVNIGIFVINSAGIGVARNQLFRQWALYEPAVAAGEWWRLIGSGFLHANLLHLAFNMFALYSIGTVLEKVLGPVKFSLIYAVSLFGGSLGVVLLSSNAVTVGASGAIFGIFGAFAVLSVTRGMSPMQSGIGSTILLNLFITFTVPGISIGGHLGGLALGAASAAILLGTNPRQAWEKRQNGNERVDVALVAALGVAALVASLLVST